MDSNKSGVCPSFRKDVEEKKSTLTGKEGLNPGEAERRACWGMLEAGGGVPTVKKKKRLGGQKLTAGGMFEKRE